MSDNIDSLITLIVIFNILQACWTYLLFYILLKKITYINRFIKKGWFL